MFFQRYCSKGARVGDNRHLRLQGCNAGQEKKDDAELLSSVTHQLNDFTMAQALTTTDLQGALPLIAKGKVRDLYEIDDKTLLFVASDRISAYDVIMENVYNSPHQYDNCLFGHLANTVLLQNRVSLTRVFSSPSARKRGSRP